MWIEVSEHEIPADMQAKAEEYREKMIDKVSMFDDELAEKFLDEKKYLLILLKELSEKGL
jgi:elongation factor G